MSLRGRNAPVGSEPSAASGRGSEVSEWPRSKFPASAARQRRNFGHRNRDIRIPRPPSHGKAVTGGFFFSPHRQGTRALPYKALRYRAGRTGSSAPTNRSVGAGVPDGPLYRTPCNASVGADAPDGPLYRTPEKPLPPLPKGRGTNHRLVEGYLRDGENSFSVRLCGKESPSQLR